MLRIFGNFTSHEKRVDLVLDHIFAKGLFELFVSVVDRTGNGREKIEKLLNQLPEKYEIATKIEIGILKPIRPDRQKKFTRKAKKKSNQ